jgi:hypothetical protein
LEYVVNRFFSGLHTSTKELRRQGSTSLASADDKTMQCNSTQGTVSAAIKTCETSRRPVSCEAPESKTRCMGAHCLPGGIPARVALQSFAHLSLHMA